MAKFEDLATAELAELQELAASLSEQIVEGVAPVSGPQSW